MSGEHNSHTPEAVDFPKIEQSNEQPRSREKAPESTEELKPIDARAEVAKALEQAPKPAQGESRKAPQTTQEHTISGTQKQMAYRKIMTDVQKEMPSSSRVFSKIIHNTVVEDTSEVVDRTVARPTSILFGSFSAFVVMSGVYLLAKHNGFRLSGSEFIALFAAGWLFGLLVDFLRHMITGQK